MVSPDLPPLSISHAILTLPYSAVFQAGGLVVVLVEVMRKAYLASIVPVIVNAVLNEHQVIVDIVAFVTKGDFPRSRLGEKQRGKILASWVTRKMRTIAQFGIRDADGADSQITEVAEPRSGLGSVVGVGSSLKNVETVTSPPANRSYEQAQDYTSLPTGVSEMPAYESSIVESPPLPPPEEDRDDTPTEPHHRAIDNHHFSITNPSVHSQDDAPVPSYRQQAEPSYLSYGQNKDLPVPPRNRDSTSPDEYPDYQAYATAGDPLPTPSDPVRSFAFDPDPPPPPARYDSKPTLSLSHDSSTNNNTDVLGNDIWTLPSQQRSDHYAPTTSSRGGLSQTPSSGSDGYRMDDAWQQEARMHMNLARDGSRRDAHVGERTGGRYHPGEGEYEGGGYGHAL